MPKEKLAIKTSNIKIFRCEILMLHVLNLSFCFKYLMVTSWTGSFMTEQCHNSEFRRDRRECYIEDTTGKYLDNGC